MEPVTHALTSIALGRAGLNKITRAATPILLIEGTRGTRAVGRSFALVQSRWWPCFAVGIVAYLLGQVVRFAGVLVLVGVILANHDTTSLRERRTSASPVTLSVCFQSTPSSSSWMQMAFSIVRGAPLESLTTAS